MSVHATVCAGGGPPPFSWPATLVLDTNTVMALWHFGDPALAGLARAIDAGRIVLVAREDALEELRRVLAYPRFGLDEPARLSRFACYRDRLARLLPPPVAGQALPPLPSCRDRDDQKFLEIARLAGAHALLSRDKALLRLHRHRLIRPYFTVATPEGWLSAQAGELAT